MRKKRLGLHISQREVARLFGISQTTVSVWEINEDPPKVQLVPELVRFLGYNPFGDIHSMDRGRQIVTARKLLGLSRRQAVERIGVCADTIRVWENGQAIASDFLAILLQTDIDPALTVSGRLLSGSQVASLFAQTGPPPRAWEYSHS